MALSWPLKTYLYRYFEAVGEKQTSTLMWQLNLRERYGEYGTIHWLSKMYSFPHFHRTIFLPPFSGASLLYSGYVFSWFISVLSQKLLGNPFEHLPSFIHGDSGNSLPQGPWTIFDNTIDASRSAWFLPSVSLGKFLGDGGSSADITLSTSALQLRRSFSEKMTKMWAWGNPRFWNSITHRIAGTLPNICPTSRQGQGKVNARLR